MTARLPTDDWQHVSWHYGLIHRTISPWHNRVLARMKGTHHLPKARGFLYAGNHTSWWDPIFMQASVGRPVCMLAKKEIMGNPFTKWFFGRGGCIPVDRDRRNPQAYEAALQALRDDRIIGIFPEGSRNHGELRPPKTGVGRLALHSGAPVVPVGILTDRFWPRGRKLPDLTETVYFNVGEPLWFKDDPEDAEAPRRVAEAVMDRIRDLLDEARAAREAGENWSSER